MTIKEIREIIDGTVLCGEEHLDWEVTAAFGSDMMSDVLAFSEEHMVLLTGLCNPQVIRTCELLDIWCIIFVRGKKPDPSVIDMARERGFVILSTDLFMYLACGRLYSKGLRGGDDLWNME